jgi:hypothetical protein
MKLSMMGQEKGNLLTLKVLGAIKPKGLNGITKIGYCIIVIYFLAKGNNSFSSSPELDFFT